MDSDGVCSAAIISKALDRLDIEHSVKFVRMLYREIVDELEPADLTIFTDLGSSQIQNLEPKFSGHDVIISDHHAPQEGGWRELVHLNAHHHGLNGVQDISGAGMTYLIARELDRANMDLSALAIVGAVGDVQDAWGQLVGYNREIIKDGVSSGVLMTETDLMLYGRHSRPIFKALEMFNDPLIPSVSNTAHGCINLLRDLNIPLKSGDGWRRLVDLTGAEKQRLATELIARAYMHVPEELIMYVPGLIIGETYTMTKEHERSMLRDAEEFATCVNSTARHEQPLIGLEVAKGDRGSSYKAMINLLRYHRRNIAKAMEFVEDSGIRNGPRGYLQYFDGTGAMKDIFVGTVAGLTLGRGRCDPYKPLTGVVSEGGVAKVSARCSKLLFLKGLDMSKYIREAARSVGGEGGGHSVACGAQVDESKVPEFLDRFEELLIKQGG